MSDVEIDVSELNIVLDGIRLRSVNVDRGVLGQILLTAIDDVIQTQGAAGAAGAWEPFSPNTHRKRGDMSEAKLLQDTGLLANMQLTEGSDYMEAHSPAEYATFHVNGTERLSVRDPFDVDQDKMLAEVEDIIMGDIERAITG